MIIDIKKHIAQQKFSGALEIDYEANQDLISIPYVEYEKPCKVKLEYWILEDNSVEVKGTVTCFLSGSCSRCLKQTSTSFTERIDAYFVPRGKKVDEEDFEYDGNEVDFSSCIDDAILFGMPFVILCDENCEGIAYEP